MSENANPAAPKPAAAAAKPADLKPAAEKPVPVLDPAKAEAISTPYRHPESRVTVAWHHLGQAFTATGIHAGEAIVDFAQHVIAEAKGLSLEPKKPDAK